MRIFRKFTVPTPEPLYNTVRYNMVLDITRIRLGPQMAIQNFFSYITYAFYSQYNTVWISNTEIVLEPKNSVVKRLACIFKSNISRFCSVSTDSSVKIKLQGISKLNPSATCECLQYVCIAYIVLQPSLHCCLSGNCHRFS